MCLRCVFAVSSKAYKADELDSLGFMMITLSEGVQNQSNPNPNALLSSPQAVSKVAIDCPTRSCLLLFLFLFSFFLSFFPGEEGCLEDNISELDR